MTTEQPTHDIASLVSNFNSLPRTPLAPSGLVPNAWHFSIRYVPYAPPRDLLFLVELQSWFMHAEDSIQPPVSTDKSITYSEKAAKVVPLLLSSFNSAFGIKDPARVPAVAPWSWMTNDAELAKAVEKELTKVGVREELCKVGVADTKEDEQCHEEWCKYVGTLTLIENI